MGSWVRGPFRWQVYQSNEGGLLRKVVEYWIPFLSAGAAAAAAHAEAGWDATELHPWAGGCPRNLEELAELYCLERLSSEERERYGEHLVACPRCIKAVEEAAAFTESIKEALRQLEVGEPYL